MITIDAWKGLATNASPYSIPPGAAVSQVNVQCVTPGQLQVRQGLTAHATGATSAVQMVRFDSATQQRVAVVSYTGAVTLITL